MERQQDYGLKRHDGNGMVMRGSGIRHDEDEPEEHSELFELAVELSRIDWERIKSEKEMSDKAEFAKLVFDNLSMTNTYPLTMEQRTRLDIRYQKARNDYLKYTEELREMIKKEEDK